MAQITWKKRTFWWKRWPLWSVKILISKFRHDAAFAATVTSANQSGKCIELARRRRQAKKFNFTLALRSGKRDRNACACCNMNARVRCNNARKKICPKGIGNSLKRFSDLSRTQFRVIFLLKCINMIKNIKYKHKSCENIRTLLVSRECNTIIYIYM